MQNSDGGWAAFDRTEDRPLLEKIPFADHNAMQDPSCPDITGRVLECLGHCGLTIADAAVRRAIAFLKKTQDVEGGWWGRWGVNFVYGSWQVLVGLRAVGEEMQSPYIGRAVRWLRSCQKPDGSWGETCRSYDEPALKGKGESTPSQTAWGTMGILAACGANDPDVARGIDWLVRHQRPDGNWDEAFYTGTGFPKVFYLKYHLYRLYFPLMALGRYRRLGGAAHSCELSHAASRATEPQDMSPPSSIYSITTPHGSAHLANRAQVEAMPGVEIRIPRLAQRSPLFSDCRRHDRSGFRIPLPRPRRPSRPGQRGAAIFYRASGSGHGDSVRRVPRGRSGAARSPGF